MKKWDKINEIQWEKTVNSLINFMIQSYGYEGGLEHLEKFDKAKSEERKQKMIKIYKSRLESLK